MKKLLLIAILSLPFFLKAQNLVANPGFETYTANTPTASTATANWPGTWTESNTDIVAETTSYKISDLVSCRLPGISASGVTNSRYVQSAIITVVPGTTYRLFVTWRIAENASDNNLGTQLTDGNLQADIYNGSSGTVTTFTPLTTTSKANLTDFGDYLAPTGITQVRIRLTKTRGIAVLDDIRLQDVTTLPIKLTSFTGKSDFNGVNLSWTTASETNNDKFTVYRSTNGKDFTEIGTIKGQGNSSSVNTYSFKDAKAVNGTNYYKLKQTDFNGASEEFSPIFVDYSLAKSSNNLKVYASQNKANLELNWQADEMVNINIIDISGRKIYSNKIQVQKGSNLINLDLAGITIGSGINILRVSGANSVEVAKFLNNQ